MTNVNSFSGPDQARIIIELTREAKYRLRKTDDDHLILSLENGLISPSLSDRHFSVSSYNLLRQISVSDKYVNSLKKGRGQATGNAFGSYSNSGVEFEIEVGFPSSVSVEPTMAPDRVILDINVKKTEESIPQPPQAQSKTTLMDTEAHPDDRHEEVSSSPDLNEVVPFFDSIKPEAIRIEQETEEIQPDQAGGNKIAGPQIKRIVIDPGHGGRDSGSVSRGGILEKDVVLDVALRLRDYIRLVHPDIEIILTRDVDRFVSLENRAFLGNVLQADLFISIHANASNSSAASGVETYVMNQDLETQDYPDPIESERAPFDSLRSDDQAPYHRKPTATTPPNPDRMAASCELASHIQASLVQGITSESPGLGINRGVKHASFLVLRNTRMPSVLAEISFLSNPREEALLRSTEFRSRIAAFLFKGLDAYLNSNNRKQIREKIPKQMSN